MNNRIAEMRSSPTSPGRRQVLEVGFAVVAFSWMTGALGRLPATPSQMLGPFYPLQPDPAAVSDLTNGGRALGGPLSVVGAVTDLEGRVLAGIVVEIWQTNANGRYHHPHDTSTAPMDPEFRGYGRCVTGTDGGYRFRTIRPVAYPGRTPHVHFRLSRREQELLVTQMYLPNQLSNGCDALFMAAGDADARQRLVGKVEGDNEATLRFDIVVNLDSATPG